MRRVLAWLRRLRDALQDGFRGLLFEVAAVLAMSTVGLLVALAIRLAV